MKKLEVMFEGRGEVKGMTFTQVKESDLGYVYKVESVGGVHYEVFKKKSGVGRFVGELREFYPGAKSFGAWAWTCGSLEKALEKLESLG